MNGTFIHILEDERAEVRLRGIQSIKMLSQHFPGFARAARDILLHMLHDDNDDVRITALEASAQILKEIKLGVNNALMLFML
jgi:hypothetical protein